jgi:hypothetical protein
MDVWIMNTDAGSEKDLENLRKVKGAKCCWTNKETGKSLSKYFTGFARIIEYADYQRGGASPEYAFKIIEGQLKGGKPNGFARIISGFKDSALEFGFYDSDTNSVTGQTLEGSQIKASDMTAADYRMQV